MLSLLHVRDRHLILRPLPLGVLAHAPLLGGLVRRRSPTMNRRAYTCVDGVVVMDDVGADMKTRIRQITHTVFAHEVMTKFPRLSQGKKDRVVQQILAEYHPREGSSIVPNKWIMDQMKACLSHRRSDVTQAIKKGAPKPWYLDQQEWDKEVEAHVARTLNATRNKRGWRHYDWRAWGVHISDPEDGTHSMHIL